MPSTNYPQIPENWAEKKVNNIEENPLDHYYCRVHFSKDSDRIYRIYPQMKAMKDSYGGLTVTDEVELWILTEQIVVLQKGKWTELSESRIRVFSDLDEAKFRAKKQIEIINNLLQDFLKSQNSKTTEFEP